MSLPAVGESAAACPGGKINLLGLPHRKLQQLLLGWGAKPLHAGQLMKWIHHRDRHGFAELTDLPRTVRDRLQASAEVRELSVLGERQSADGTRKWLLQTQGGDAIETVFIPEAARGTLCVSSQVGCALNCSFCSTGRQGFSGNLTAGDLVAQVRLAQRLLRPVYPERRQPVTNVVLMGMGEPLLNLDAVMDAVAVLQDDLGYGISRRRLTISTAGLIPGIYRLAGMAEVALAISLHAPDDRLRDQLMPINRKYPIAQLLAACRHYLQGQPRGSTITIEYILIDQVNSLPEHAVRLARLLSDLPCKVNLIPFNPYPGSGYQRPSEAAVQAFRNLLNRAGLVSTIRSTRGDDIQAACGQLTGTVRVIGAGRTSHIPLASSASGPPDLSRQVRTPGW